MLVHRRPRSAKDAPKTDRAGLEPATARLEGGCSIQLSYRSKAAILYFGGLILVGFFGGVGYAFLVMVECFVGLGGNFSGSLEVMGEACHALSRFRSFRQSKFYRTTPVSSFAQAGYVNAVAGFECSWSLEKLWAFLRRLERVLGKEPKAKEAPRLIDIDLLFYGDSVVYRQDLVVPHPKWHERLFVLAPLADVTDEVPLGLRVQELLARFKNPHGEMVWKI